MILFLSLFSEANGTDFLPLVVYECAQNYSVGSHCTKIGTVQQFSALNLPSSFSKFMLEDAIKSMIATVKGIAFNEVGVQEDWDHGHLLMSKSDELPKGIIFHTQEGVYPIGLCRSKQMNCDSDFLMKFKKDLYSYDGPLKNLDPIQRSWIYLFSSKDLEPGMRYVYDRRPKTLDIKLWNGWKSAATATDGNIDPAKLGFDFYFEKESGQINFGKIRCDDVAGMEIESTNIIRISKPNNSDLCLYVYTTNFGRPI